MPAPTPSRPRLILVCGLPGAGKTTLAARLEESTGGVRMCPDEWMIELGIDLFDQPARARIEGIQWELAQNLLAQGCVVIIEWGLWTRGEREQLRKRARDLDAAVELRFLDASVDILWERVSRRGREQIWGSRSITRVELERWWADFEAPGPEELRLYDPPVD